MEQLGEALRVTLLQGAYLALLLLVPLWGPQLVFKNLATRRVGPLRTFSIADALFLTAYLALANAIVALARDLMMDISWRITLAALANALALLMWIKSQRFMRASGIQAPSSRVLVQGILYPVANVVPGIFAASLFNLVGATLDLIQGGRAAFTWKSFLPFIVAASAISLTASIAIIIALRAGFRKWVANGSAPPTQTSDESSG